MEHGAVRRTIDAKRRKTANTNGNVHMLNHFSPVRCIFVTLPTTIQLVNVLLLLLLLLLLHVLLRRHLSLLLWHSPLRVRRRSHRIMMRLLHMWRHSLPHTMMWRRQVPSVHLLLLLLWGYSLHRRMHIRWPGLMRRVQRGMRRISLRCPTHEIPNWSGRRLRWHTRRMIRWGLSHHSSVAMLVAIVRIVHRMMSSRHSHRRRISYMPSSRLHGTPRHRLTNNAGLPLLWDPRTVERSHHDSLRKQSLSCAPRGIPSATSLLMSCSKEEHQTQSLARILQIERYKLPVSDALPRHLVMW
jgi:hypothetical protein